MLRSTSVLRALPLQALTAAAMLGALPSMAQAQLLKSLPPPMAPQQITPLARPVGPGPTSVQVSGTPNTAVVTWTLPPAKAASGQSLGTPIARNASTPPPTGSGPGIYVERLAEGVAAVRLPPIAADATSVTDVGPLMPGQPVTYRVTVTDGGGVSGAKDAAFTPPMPRDPSDLTATVQADGSVTLRWQAVAEGGGYLVSGTALAAPVVVRYAKEWRSAPLRPGAQQWKVATVYEPGGVMTTASAWPAVISRVIPVSQPPFLSRPAPGSVAYAQAHFNSMCTSRNPQSTEDQCPRKLMSRASNWREVWDSAYGGSSPSPQWSTAVFADTHDLGLGRRVACARSEELIPRMGITTCWASSHGRIPAPGRAPDGMALAALAAAEAETRSVNIIVSWTGNGIVAPGSFFATWESKPGLTWPAGVPGGVRDGVILEGGQLALAATLDNQGAKSVPHACLSCHGGRYDANTGGVVGATLLPLVPAQLAFGSPQARLASEEAVRKINQVIYDSGAATAVREQIQTMYGGQVATPGTTVDDSAVPAGWAQQPGLYRQVIAPYCAGCHFAQTGPFTFSSWSNMLQHKQVIQNATCRSFTMPHSEQTFRRFWTEGGSVSLPGLLSTALGFSKCPE